MQIVLKKEISHNYNERGYGTIDVTLVVRCDDMVEVDRIESQIQSIGFVLPDNVRHDIGCTSTELHESCVKLSEQISELEKSLRKHKERKEKERKEDQHPLEFLEVD